MDIEKWLTSTIGDFFGIEEEKIASGTSLVDDLGLDSLDAIELLMEIESEFGIEVHDDFVTESLTVGDVVKHISDLVAAKAD